MGTLVRQFWLPALLEAEMAEPDCDPVRLRLLGEDLVAFRDTNGRVGIIEPHCAHRREFLGRSDRAIISFRRQLLSLVKDCANGGEPEMARNGAWYNVRSASVILSREQPFESGAAWLLDATKRAAAE